MIYVGFGKENVDMYRGNYKIEDYLTERRPLAITGVEEDGSGCYLLNFENQILLTTRNEKDVCVLSGQIPS